MEGWIKLHKRFLEWEWYCDNNVKILFIHLLLKANFIDKEWKGIMIKRGQLFTSILHLSKELNLTVKQVRISLHKICTTGEITEKGASNGTMITICNYDSYQQEIETKGQTKGKRRANEGQQHKNIRIEEDKNIETRSNIFGESLKQFITNENRDEVIKFWNHWTQPEQNKENPKLKFELEKTWDTKKRLVTWLNNSKKWSK